MTDEERAFLEKFLAWLLSDDGPRVGWWNFSNRYAPPEFTEYEQDDAPEIIKDFEAHLEQTSLK